MGAYRIFFRGEKTVFAGTRVFEADTEPAANSTSEIRKSFCQPNNGSVGAIGALSKPSLIERSGTRRAQGFKSWNQKMQRFEPGFDDDRIERIFGDLGLGGPVLVRLIAHAGFRLQ
jgi:hypothetical protein